jgi:disulfide bond formation protein DsbB
MLILSPASSTVIFRPVWVPANNAAPTASRAISAASPPPENVTILPVFVMPWTLLAARCSTILATISLKSDASTGVTLFDAGYRAGGQAIIYLQFIKSLE